MINKEVLEIRKQFTKEDHVIDRICGCYVSGEKEIRFKSKEAFHSLPEEALEKYLDIFKHSLSGTLGKNLLNMDFPLDEEMPQGKQEFLFRLKQSQLQDDELIDAFYDKIIEHYDCGTNYYIVLIHATYDVPGKSTDGSQMFDASDSVYDFVLCSLCPVTLSKPGLGYNIEKNTIEERIRDWVVAPPANAFLFPAFNDRDADVHSLLFYSKNPEAPQFGLIDEVFGTTQPLSAKSQKETFHALIEETLGEDGDYNVIKNIHETLNEMIEENKSDPEPLLLTKNEVKRVFEKSEVPEEKMEQFDKKYEELAEENTTFLASNIAETKKFNIETPDVVIKVNSDRTDLVETRVIDGRQCLVIAVSDHIEVNGINVKTILQD